MSLEHVKPRLMPDGTLVFIRRGGIPPDQDGYIRDPGNAYHFFPIWGDCSHRQKHQYVSKCCGGITVFYSCDKGFEATYKNCKDCIAQGKNL